MRIKMGDDSDNVVQLVQPGPDEKKRTAIIYAENDLKNTEQEEGKK